jgi:hypothetical protein
LTPRASATDALRGNDNAPLIIRRYDIYYNFSQEANSQNLNAAFGG